MNKDEGVLSFKFLRFSFDAFRYTLPDNGLQPSFAAEVLAEWGVNTPGYRGPLFEHIAVGKDAQVAAEVVAEGALFNVLVDSDEVPGRALQLCASVALPLIGLLILLYCVYKIFYAQQAMQTKKESREALCSRSPSFAMPATNSRATDAPVIQP